MLFYLDTDTKNRVKANAASYQCDAMAQRTRVVAHGDIR